MAFSVQTYESPEPHESMLHPSWRTVTGGNFHDDHKADVAARKLFEIRQVPTRVVNERGAVLTRYPIET